MKSEKDIERVFEGSVKLVMDHVLVVAGSMTDFQTEVDSVSFIWSNRMPYLRTMLVGFMAWDKKGDRM